MFVKHFFKLRQLSLYSSAAVVVLSAAVQASPVSDIQQQRASYDKAQKLLDKKRLQDYQALRPKLVGYPLLGYTDYRAFMLGLSDESPKQVETFIDTHLSYPFSTSIRPAYLEILAQQKKWRTLLTFQPHVPKGEAAQCNYYTAQYHQGNQEKAFSGVSKLWLSGQSIASQCDALIEAWSKAGHKTDDVVLKRMLLAFSDGNSKLMNYLARQLSSNPARKQAREMQALYRQPESVLTFAERHPKNDTFYQSQIHSAIKKLARRDAPAAQKAFVELHARADSNAEEEQDLADFIAYRLMNTDNPKLAEWRDKVIALSSEDKIKERRTRLAIQQADWREVPHWIALMTPKAQGSLRWQYWLGRSEIELGESDEGKQRLDKLIGKRNFYSVAAADEMGKAFTYPTSSVQFDQQVLQPYQATLNRIAELIARDKISAAKTEWNWLLAHSDQREKKMLAVYAAEKQWAHLTVTASISAKLWDNLQLRFPVAHLWWFDHFAEKYDMDPITLISLARQESALDVQARSPVGARGIMQIMPRTAQYTAKKYRIPYRGAHDLYQVGKNIEIGSTYLNSLLNKYNNNRVLALAAYNAGPHRVKKWREKSAQHLDVFAFIESIPFNETRGYVQNILMFETYYRDLMGVDGQFLTDREAKAKY